MPCVALCTPLPLCLSKTLHVLFALHSRHAPNLSGLCDPPGRDKPHSRSAASQQLGKAMLHTLQRLEWETFDSAAQAIYECQKIGIVHRDLKPENFIICKDRVKLIDFGLAVPFDDPSEILGGTPHYMAPEAWIQEVSSARTVNHS